MAPRKKRTPEEQEIFDRERKIRAVERQKLRRQEQQNIVDNNRDLHLLIYEDRASPINVAAMDYEAPQFANEIFVNNTLSEENRERTLFHAERRRYRNQALRADRMNLNEAVRHHNSNNDRDLRAPTSEDYLGPMNIACMHCGALHFADKKVSNKGLSFNDCFIT